MAKILVLFSFLVVFFSGCVSDKLNRTITDRSYKNQYDNVVMVDNYNTEYVETRRVYKKRLHKNRRVYKRVLRNKKVLTTVSKKKVYKAKKVVKKRKYIKKVAKNKKILKVSRNYNVLSTKELKKLNKLSYMKPKTVNQKSIPIKYNTLKSYSKIKSKKRFKQSKKIKYKPVVKLVSRNKSKFKTTLRQNRKIRLTATAYTSHKGQTDKTPFLAAWNNRIKPGMKIIAVSRDLIKKHGLKNGKKVKIKGLKGHYVVKDKMNKRFKNRIDIYMGLNKKKALKWGKRKVTLIY